MKASFKQTEIGQLPSDWKLEKLGSIGSWKKGRNIPKSSLSVAGVPCVLYGEIYTKYDSVVTKLDSRLPAELAADSTTIQKGDILFAGSGETAEEIGKCFAYLGAQPAYAGGDLIILSPKQGESAFLGYLLNSPAIVKQKSVRGQGSSVVHIYTSSLATIDVPMPPQREQKAIAEALGDVDGLLAGLERLIAKKRAVKTAVMQELLTGRRRLPGFFGRWETKRLGEITTITMGRTPSRRDLALWGKGHTWLSIADLKSKWITTSNEEITDLAASQMTSIPKGTLLMSFKLSIGRLAFAGCELFTNEAICAFHQPQAHPEYLYYVLGQTDFSLYGKQAVKGYTLNKESLNAVEVLCPPMEEQRAIATVLSDIDVEITALAARRAKTQAIKQGMMQELLTGRTRLVE